MEYYSLNIFSKFLRKPGIFFFQRSPLCLSRLTRFARREVREYWVRAQCRNYFTDENEDEKLVLIEEKLKNIYNINNNLIIFLIENETVHKLSSNRENFKKTRWSFPELLLNSRSKQFLLVADRDEKKTPPCSDHRSLHRIRPTVVERFASETGLSGSENGSILIGAIDGIWDKFIEDRSCTRIEEGRRLKERTR